MPVPDLREVLVYLEQGQPEEAIPLLEHLTRERPAHVTVHLLLARAFEQVGRVQAARALWQAARFLMPNSPVVRDGLRRIEMQAPGPSAPPPSEAPAGQTETSSSQDAEPTAAVEAPVEEHVPAAPVLHEAEPPAATPPPEEAASHEPEARAEDEPAAPVEPRPNRPMTTNDLLASLQQQRHPSDLADDDDDLQRLIDELEAARIEPSPDLDDIPPPELDSDIEDMVSETLARIYVAQGQHRDAAKVYLQLARQHPERAEEFEERAEELRQQAAEKEEE